MRDPGDVVMKLSVKVTVKSDSQSDDTLISCWPFSMQNCGWFTSEINTELSSLLLCAPVSNSMA